MIVIQGKTMTPRSNLTTHFSLLRLLANDEKPKSQRMYKSIDQYDKVRIHSIL